MRCHPNYCNEGLWYDWVIVHFKTEEDFEELPLDHCPQYQRDCVPCKILAFAEHQPKGKESSETWSLVHGCNFRTTTKQSEMDSCLIEHWELAYHNVSAHLPLNEREKGSYWSPLLTWIKPESILCRCLVVKEEPGIFETLPMSQDTKISKRQKPRNKVLLIKQRQLWPLEFTI